MADEKEDTKVNEPIVDPHQQSIPFVEVLCNSSGKYRRFAIGTDAGFALTFMNNKLRQTEAEAHPSSSSLSSHIEAVKEGEEPIVFGPTATLVNYGHGWKLQTVTLAHKGVGKGVGSKGVQTGMKKTDAKDSENLDSTNITLIPTMSPQYIGKIFLALVLIFVFGATFTLILENLPQLILYASENV